MATLFQNMECSLQHSNGTFSFVATGSGDGKMTRLDAQSPTVQGAQSNQPSQSQQGPGGQGSQQGSNQSQQYMSLPPGYHPTGYYYPGVMSHYGIFQQVSQSVLLQLLS